MAVISFFLFIFLVSKEQLFTFSNIGATRISDLRPGDMSKDFLNGNIGFVNCGVFRSDIITFHVLSSNTVRLKIAAEVISKLLLPFSSIKDHFITQFKVNSIFIGVIDIRTTCSRDLIPSFVEVVEFLLRYVDKFVFNDLDPIVFPSVVCFCYWD